MCRDSREIAVVAKQLRWECVTVLRRCVRNIQFASVAIEVATLESKTIPWSSNLPYDHFFHVLDVD